MARLLQYLEQKALSVLANRVLRGEVDSCWEWQGGTSDNGYGMVQVALPAHRVAYMVEYGEIPDGLVIDHLCRNRRCCNPQHLEAVTQGENFLRGEHASVVTRRNQVCKRGHDLSISENVYVHSRPGRSTIFRSCRICRAQTMKDYKRKARRG